jgi:hypothetical protein
MQSNKPRTALPTVAGILILISGGFRLLGALGVIIASVFISIAPEINDIFQNPLLIFLIFGIFLLISGVIAIVGGIYTLQRRNWGMSLTGAIFAFLPFQLLGLASIILVAISRQEFEN